MTRHAPSDVVPRVRAVRDASGVGQPVRVLVRDVQQLHRCDNTEEVMDGKDRLLTLPLTGGAGAISPDQEGFTEEDSLRLTAVLALDGHRLRLNRQEKAEVVRLALARSYSREQAAHQLGIAESTFAVWAKRAGAPYPVTKPPLWWVHGYARPNKCATARR